MHYSNFQIIPSVLPPSTSKYYPQFVDSIPKSVMDTNNVLEQQDPEELKLVVGEGTYTLRDSVLVAMPPPHPADTPAQPPNPLDTSKKPPTTGAKLSLAIVGPKAIILADLLKQQFSTRPPTPEHQSDHQFGHQLDNQELTGHVTPISDQNPDHTSDTDISNSDIPVFGHNNPSLLATIGVKESREAAASKRKKPKNNMIKTNSSFISRVYPAESLGKKVGERNPNGIFAFVNVSRSFHWLDLSSLHQTKAESLIKILFQRANALCHDINYSTSNHPSHIDVIIGFSTADLLWYEPISQKYSRINKNGIITESPIFDVKWMPSSPNLLVTAHSDGTLVVFDKEKEDAPFVPEESPTSSVKPSAQKPFLGVLKSVQSVNQKTNPVAFWKLTTHRINAIAFSPDGLTLATVSSEGRLRLIDFHNEKLLDVFNSFFGELYCVCWSPDGNYILTGGQDDLVSIWSFTEKRLVARFKGHRNWVKWVSFDPWRCDERNYRFGSVGDDCQLLLWDFNMGMVHTPRSNKVQNRASVSSIPTNTDDEVVDLDKGVAPVHEAPLTTEVPMILPLMNKKVDDHQLSWIDFQEDCIVTSCRRGHIRIWNRPEDKIATRDQND